MARDIALPPGADIRLLLNPPYSTVLVAPLPHKASWDLFSTPGAVSGLFTHDPGMHWPDDRCCRFAEQYLAIGVPIGLQFAKLADALKCQARLKQGAPA